MMFTTPSRGIDPQPRATPTDEERTHHTAQTMGGACCPSQASDLDHFEVGQALQRLAQASTSQAVSILQMSESLEALCDAFKRLEIEHLRIDERANVTHDKYQAHRRKLGVESLLLAEELKVDPKLSVNMVAELLNVHRTTVYARVNQGKFPRYDKSNGKTEWPLSVVRQFLANKSQR